jgi:hypothetical protein
MAIRPMPTQRMTPATIPTDAKALGTLREPSAMASTIKRVVSFIHPRRLYFCSPSWTVVERSRSPSYSFLAEKPEPVLLPSLDKAGELFSVSWWWSMASVKGPGAWTTRSG